uniref:Dual specificity protein phosphatase n=1 Tax=Salvator merianae TaxID=96440 RepID=A0A8D0B579_SALMN
FCSGGWAVSMEMAEESISLSKDLENSETSTAETPTVKDIEQLLNTGRPSCNHVDEVWPNLFLGDLVTAHNRFGLWKMGISHVLNAAHGKIFCQGSHEFYGSTIEYYGVPAYDLPDFDISPYFYPAAEFIHKALTTPGGMTPMLCNKTRCFIVGYWHAGISLSFLSEKLKSPRGTHFSAPSFKSIGQSCLISLPSPLLVKGHVMLSPI